MAAWLAITLLAAPDASARVRVTLAARALPPALPGEPFVVPDGDGPAYRLPVRGRVLRERADPESGARPAGLLIAALGGAPVLAPGGGRIAYAGRFRGYGDVLILDHGRGWTSVLTGLARIDAVQGARIAGGERLGMPGERVRLRLLHHGRDVDPARVLARVTGSARSNRPSPRSDPG